MSTAMMTGLGARKVAIVLVQMGREKAASVLAHLNENEVEAVSAEIAALTAVAPEESRDVLGEFHQLMVARAHMIEGGLDFAQHVLEKSLGNDRAAEIVSRLSAMAIQLPFQFLHRADPVQLRSFIAEEHPQVIALILAHMTPDKASLVLSGLPPEQQAEVAHRIAVMDRSTPDIVRNVETILERKLSSVLQPSESSRVGGIGPLVNIINRSDRATERQIVEGLESRDTGLADEVRSRMFLLEDIVSLEDRAVQLVLRTVETNDLAVALKGVSESVRDKITSNLSERAAENLLDELSLLGPVRLAQVEEAQQTVIRAIRALEEKGDIIIRRGSDDEYVE